MDHEKIRDLRDRDKSQNMDILTLSNSYVALLFRFLSFL